LRNDVLLHLYLQLILDDFNRKIDITFTMAHGKKLTVAK
jgi:hypothetical protein